MTERLFIIGAQRSGSTLLARLAAMHPDIEVAPQRPEPKYFLADGTEDAAAEDYDLEVFGSLPTTPIRAEKSTTYIERAPAAARMHACFSHAHVVAVLRDPVERALSNYRFSVMHGWEDRPVSTAMSVEGQRRPWPADQLSTSPYDYLRRGRYAELLEPWLHQFGRRLHLLLHADVTRPGHALADLVAELGSEPFDWPTRPEVVNASPASPLDGEAEARARLTEYYRPHNEVLSRRFDIDVTAWSGVA